MVDKTVYSDSASRHGAPDGDLSDEAAYWFMQVKLSTPSPETQERFRQWLRASDDHAEAFALAEESWSTVGEMASEPEVMELRSLALRRSASHRHPRGFAVSRRSAAVAAVGSVFCAATGLWAFGKLKTNTYETGIGERRVITLADNSKVTLDAGTRLQVSYTAEARNIQLQRGQAFFEVAKDTLRPFKVAAGDQTIVALGTAFNVEKMPLQTLVTLLEGRVAVHGISKALDHGVSKSSAPMPSQQSNAKEQQLSPGEQLSVDGQGEAVLRRQVPLTQTVAWTRGQLIFEDEPLSSAITRINRYSQTQVVISDQSISEIRISGIFNTGDTAAFVEALSQYFAVDISMQQNGDIQLKRL